MILLHSISSLALAAVEKSRRISEKVWGWFSPPRVSSILAGFCSGGGSSDLSRRSSCLLSLYARVGRLPSVSGEDDRSRSMELPRELSLETLCELPRDPLRELPLEPLRELPRELRLLSCWVATWEACSFFLFDASSFCFSMNLFWASFSLANLARVAFCCASRLAFRSSSSRLARSSSSSELLAEGLSVAFLKLPPSLSLMMESSPSKDLVSLEDPAEDALVVPREDALEDAMEEPLEEGLSGASLLDAASLRVALPKLLTPEASSLLMDSASSAEANEADAKDWLLTLPLLKPLLWLA